MCIYTDHVYIYIIHAYMHTCIHACTRWVRRRAGNAVGAAQRRAGDAVGAVSRRGRRAGGDVAMSRRRAGEDAVGAAFIVQRIRVLL